MTDGLEAARRSEVAESFRYARAFYDEAEATGPAEFERNRQAIIDVIALAYRDGQSSARASESALRAAALESATLAENIAAHIDDLGGSGGDTVRSIASILEAALGGAPWEPSEEMVERAATALQRWDADDHPYEVMARAALRAAFNPPPAGPPTSA